MVGCAAAMASYFDGGVGVLIKRLVEGVVVRTGKDGLAVIGGGPALNGLEVEGDGGGGDGGCVYFVDEGDGWGRIVGGGVSERAIMVEV